MQLSTVQTGEQSAKSGDDSLDKRQSILSFFKSSCMYLEKDVLSDIGKEHVLNSFQYEIVHNILYHTERKRL